MSCALNQDASFLIGGRVVELLAHADRNDSIGGAMDEE